MDRERFFREEAASIDLEYLLADIAEEDGRDQSQSFERELQRDLDRVSANLNPPIDRHCEEFYGYRPSKPKKPRAKRP